MKSLAYILSFVLCSSIVFAQETTTVLSVQGVIIAIILGTLFAIVYSLRILVLLERRISRMDENIEVMAKKIIEEEFKIEKKLANKRSAKKSKRKR